MEYISTKEYADLHGVSERTVRNYCVQGYYAAISVYRANIQ